MKKIFGYLSVHSVVIIFCMLCLFVQALCDLNLPNFMSNIVNVGIQQNGIEHAAPSAISEKGFTFMELFMAQEEQALVNQNYTLIHSSQDSEYHASYPVLHDENIYVLREDSSSIRELDECFSKAYMTFINVMRTHFSSTNSEAQPINMSSMDLSKVYQLAPVIKDLPPSVIANEREKASTADPAMISQIGVTITKQIYLELGFNVSDIQNRYMMKIGLFMVIVTMISAVASIIVSFFSAKIAAFVAKKLRHDVFSRVESFSHHEFDKLSVASLITRTTNDITQIQTFIIMAIRILCYAPIVGVGGVIMAINTSNSMSFIIALSIFVLTALICLVFYLAIPKFKITQKLTDRLNLVLRENLTGLMVIRSFGTQKFEEKRFDDVNRAFTKNNIFINRIMVFMMPTMMFIMNSTALLVVWVGGHRVADSQMQVGDMMAFIQYCMQIIMAFLMIAVMFIMVPRATVSAARVAEVLDLEPSVQDCPEITTLRSAPKGVVEFKDVSFRYHGAETDVLENINFTANPGETTAFIGSTGSGKSTLINLIPRFYDVTAGQIFIDGVDIRDLSLHNLRDMIGYVPQKGILFSGTVASNLRYSDKNATDTLIATSAQIAQAMDFISEGPLKFDRPISQGGTNVSGGQRQRLSIARALVKKSPIYIFDDSLSALDFKTDKALRLALKNYINDSTVLLVAQRISTIMHAEQIIVLDEGKIVGIGRHRELLESCTPYREIAMSQLSKEELQ